MYFVQGVLQDRLGLVPFALGHVTRRLAIQQDQGGRVFIGHLLEDVEGVLQLLASLFEHFTRPREGLGQREDMSMKCIMIYIYLLAAEQLLDIYIFFKKR